MNRAETHVMRDLDADGKGWRPQNAKELLFGVLIFAWPFLYYFRFVVPECSFSLGIGNDFVLASYAYKVYFLDLLANGHFPLWSPAEGGGYPFCSSPWTQFFYPLNLPLLIFYKIFGGYSIFDHQAFTIFGLSIYALGLYLWLRRLVSNRKAVIFAVLTISASFKLGEILRFPNAVHSAAWMPWILYGVTLACQKGKALKPGLIIFLSCVMLLTAGYPYYIYYCLFLIPFYAASLLFSPIRKAVLQERAPSRLDRKKFLLTLLVPSMSALVVCSPYLYKTIQLLNQTTDRNAPGYQFSTSFDFTPLDTLGSLVFPPAAQTEGWFYFSILGVLLLALYAAGVLWNRQARRAEILFLVLMFAWVAMVISITHGEHSPVFNFLWRYLPGFDRLRVWGRLNIILLPVLALLLARAYRFFETRVLGDGLEGARRKRALVFSLVVLGGATLAILAVQIWLHQREVYDKYWLEYFTQLHGLEWTFITSSILSFSLAAFVLVRAFKRPSITSKFLIFTLVIFLSVTVYDMYLVGTRQWVAEPLKGYGFERKVVDINRIIENSFNVPRERRHLTLTERFNVGWIENWYYQRYMDFDRKIFRGIKEVKSQEDLPYYYILMGLKDGKRIFVSQRIDYTSIKDFILDAAQSESEFISKMEVKYYDGDILKLLVQAQKSLYVSFIDNWDPDWRALVNNGPVDIEKLFGTFKSVRVGSGENKIEFAYRPFF